MEGPLTTLRRLFWQGLWFYRRKLARGRGAGLVLDVGSGNSPHLRADILVERELEGGSDRWRGRRAMATAPLVIADAEALPFADSTFDYVVASHLIEHVDHPDRVLAELSRVGRAGYIECPNSDYDKLDSPSYHRWFAELDGSTLVVRQKERAVFDDGIKDLVHSTLYADSGFWSAFWRHLERFFVMFEWSGEIDFRVEYLPLEDGTPGSADRSVFDDDRWLSERGFDPEEYPAPGKRSGYGDVAASALWKFLRLAFRPRGGKIDVFALVRCPVDLEELTRRGSVMTCTGCGAEYEIEGEIPILLPPERKDSRP